MKSLHRDEMPDGTVYGGVSPDTNKPMFVTPVDASLTMKFNDAQEYAARLNAHGHKDWRLPTKAELNVLFYHRAAIGGFDTSGSPTSCYWSSSQYNQRGAAYKYFSDGYQNIKDKNDHSSVRCVR